MYWVSMAYLGYHIQKKKKVLSIYREASSFGLEHLQKLLTLEQFVFSILTLMRPRTRGRRRYGAGWRSHEAPADPPTLSRAPQRLQTA